MTLNFWDPEIDGLSFNVLVGANRSKLHLMDSLGGTDPMLLSALERDSKPPFTCRMLCSEREVRKSRLYRELLQPEGIEYRLTLHWKVEPARYTYVIVMRGLQAGPFTSEEVELAGELTPHIDRAVRIFQKLVVIESERSAVFDSLDNLRVGILLFNSLCRVVYANRAATRILGEDDGLRLTGGRLSCEHPAANRAMDASVRHIAECALRGEPSRSEVVIAERRSGAPSYSLLISPTPSNATSSSPVAGFGGPVGICFLSDPLRAGPPPIQGLRRQFGFTAQEAHVVAQVVAGHDVPEVANRLALKPDTVRRYLKRAYRKTGVHERSGLVARIAASYGWLEPMERVVDL